MNVGELRDALNQFKPTGTVSVVVPTAMQRFVRAVNKIEHLDDPKGADPSLPLEILVDNIDKQMPPRIGRPTTITDLLNMLSKYPDETFIRIAVPVDEVTHSHRILDVVTVGFTTGTGQGSGVELIGEPWESMTWIIRGVPTSEERERQAAAKSGDAA